MQPWGDGPAKQVTGPAALCHGDTDEPGQPDERLRAQGLHVAEPPPFERGRTPVTPHAVPTSMRSPQQARRQLPRTCSAATGDTAPSFRMNGPSSSAPHSPPHPGDCADASCITSCAAGRGPMTWSQSWSMWPTSVASEPKRCAKTRERQQHADHHLRRNGREQVEHRVHRRLAQDRVLQRPGVLVEPDERAYRARDDLPAVDADSQVKRDRVGDEGQEEDQPRSEERTSRDACDKARPDDADAGRLSRWNVEHTGRRSHSTPSVAFPLLRQAMPSAADSGGIAKGPDGPPHVNGV